MMRKDKPLSCDSQGNQCSIAAELSAKPSVLAKNVALCCGCLLGETPGRTSSAPAVAAPALKLPSFSACGPA